MMRTLLCFLLLCCPLFGQTVEVLDSLPEVTNFRTIGKALYVAPNSNLKANPVGIVTIPTTWADPENEADPYCNVMIIAEDETDTPVPFFPIEPTIFQINGTGTVKVTLINQKPFFFNRYKLVLTPPGPGPGPGPGPNPPPVPVPSDIPNDYGVGLIAYKNAPRNAETLVKYAKIYEQAGNFLFGDPTLKAISFPNAADNTNPDKNVLAWMSQQINAIPCPDLAVCQQWKTWQTEVRKAFDASQAKQTFTRQDWYKAFNEVSLALKMVK